MEFEFPYLCEVCPVNHNIIKFNVKLMKYYTFPNRLSIPLHTWLV